MGKGVLKEGCLEESRCEGKTILWKCSVNTIEQMWKNCCKSEERRVAFGLFSLFIDLDFIFLKICVGILLGEAERIYFITHEEAYKISTVSDSETLSEHANWESDKYMLLWGGDGLKPKKILRILMLICNLQYLGEVNFNIFILKTNVKRWTNFF